MRKGVYPLNDNSWWMTHPAGRDATTSVVASSNKECRYWYCPCCGGRFNAGRHLPYRLMIIVPPNSKHSAKKQGKDAESDEESQASTQASTTAYSTNPNAAKGNIKRPARLRTNKELEKDNS
eukprot:1010187-Prorocentrum_lima.AAC.1